MQISRTVSSYFGSPLAILSGLCLILLASPAVAQVGSTTGGAASRELARIRNQSVGNQFSSAQLNGQTLINSRAAVPWSSGLNQGLFLNQSIGGSSPASKPFTNISSSPTVSPYLGLFNNLSDGVLPNYNQFVQPRLQQQQFNRTQSRQNQLINQRVQQISAQSAFEVRGSQYQAPTGHSTGFMYYSHFYPSNNRRR